MGKGEKLRGDAANSVVAMIEGGQRQREEQQQRVGRTVRWSSDVVLAIAVFFLAMGGLPTPAQSLHNKGYSYLDVSDSKAELVNATAKFAKSWRTGFHFQPRKNWMNGPMFYKGYYHLFYQYDPFAALWGNITWGHAVSKDLIHWKYLDDAAIQGGPGWYDILGAWSGSATMMKDGTPAMLYTGWSNVSTVFQIQTQNLVLPVDPSDPLLRKWYKSESNPVIVAEPFMNASNFRDPTEAWHGEDGEWRILVGGKEADGSGTAHVYKSADFVKWSFVHDLHIVPGTGMWECPDFYPVALQGKKGLDVSVMSLPLPKGKRGPRTKSKNSLVKHVVKASLDNDKHDYYAVGTYDESGDTFKADDAKIDVGIGLRYDYGKYYASKTFFDHKTSRRILTGWINESTSDQNAVITGWSGLQAIPRQLWLDPKTLVDLIQTPVEELDGLHRDKYSKTEFTLSAGSVVPIEGISGAQVDIQVKFYKPDAARADLAFDGSTIAASSAQEMCSASGGAALRGYYGPFGVLVLVDKELQEQTAVYFYLSYPSSPGNKWKAIFCSDQSRSSLQIGTDETMYGTYIRVLESDKYLTLRAVVDHSIVETFIQDGRAVITSRVYPTVAIDGAAQSYLFNNGTADIEVHSITAWKMANIDLVQF